MGDNERGDENAEDEDAAGGVGGNRVAIDAWLAAMHEGQKVGFVSDK
jgi:hypothetical protein